MFTLSIITVSDKGYSGEREDLSGKMIEELTLGSFDVISKTIVPDEVGDIEDAIKSAVKAGANLILTTGGTGFSKRDVTPEATKAVIEKEALGIAEAIRFNSLKYTSRAMLSRGTAGICGSSLIVNLPGSPKAVKEALDFILPVLPHGLEVLCGLAHDCARKN
ncbi:MAG: MogA/MoaB family molybdenum cofactor biosynthesis protein [Clostridia bacterium]